MKFTPERQGRESKAETHPDLDPPRARPSLRPRVPGDPALLAREARAATELARPELARVLGVPEETLAAWEEGRRLPTPGERALLRVVLLAPEVCLDLLPDA
ncbi:MAG: hypothetical protein KIT58_16830 [Planctomycetota bacterium]|nr:hypothetical protein [Planctomycetota bacterium]